MWAFRIASAVVAVASAARSTPQSDLSPEVVAWREHHKPKPPSPKQLAEKFAEKQHQKEKSQSKRETYLRSDVHLSDARKAGMMRAHQERFHLHQVEWEADNLHDNAQEKRCGSHVSTSNFGLKDTEAVQYFFKHTSLLQGSPGLARPSAGSDQTLADNGRSITGTVRETHSDDNREDDQAVEPYVKVFKDGYSFAMCAKDKMFEFGDKFGDNKDKYGKEHSNISIALYDELILKEAQKAMTPQVCFEFCRSVPNMVYFGITAGRTCYCTPYFEKMESGSDNCDMPCPGQPTQMCGGLHKSQVFEMHMCADTAGDVLYQSVHTEVALVHFYDVAFMTEKLASKLQEFGEKFQAVAGASGDPGVTEMAQAAKVEAGALYDASTGWGECQNEFTNCIEQYKKAEKIEKMDFSFVKNLEKAESAIAYMNLMTGKLNQCAKDSIKPIEAVFPFYHDYMAALDRENLQALQDKYAPALGTYMPTQYVIERDQDPAMSTCEGTRVGKPMPVNLAGCAEACDRMRSPARCAAFQYLQKIEGSKMSHLCIMLQDVKKLRTYTSCDFMGESLLARKVNVSAKSFRGEAPGAVAAEKSFCQNLARTRTYSGLSCESIFGKDSSVLEKCPKECSESMGGKTVAVCMNSMASHINLADVKVQWNRRCFDNANQEIEQGHAQMELTEFGKDASGGSGAKIEGDVSMGGKTIEEPYGHVWTPGPAGAR